MTLPTLIVVSGPLRADPSRLAHALAKGIGCPAICRDEIKEGMSPSLISGEPRLGDAVAIRASKTLFAVLDVLIRNRVTVVAEAELQESVLGPALECFVGRAHIKVVRCFCGSHLGSGKRPRSKENAARATIAPGFPTLDVDASDGYHPGLDEIILFVKA